MPKGVFSLVQTKTIPGRCRVHLIHAEEDLLCDWQPSQFERHVIAHRLDYTVVSGSDKWMGASKQQYLHWLRWQLPLGRHELAHLKLRHPEVIPVRDGMAAPLSGSALKPSWIDTSGAQRLPSSCLPSTSDDALLPLLNQCVPDQGITSMEEAQALLLRNFRVGGQESECTKWLTAITRDLLRRPIPFREVFVILALFLPQLPFAEGAQLAMHLWTSPVVRRQETIVQVTPVAQGLRDMDEYRIAFPTHSGASIFCAQEPTEQQYRQLFSMPSDKVHVGCQVGKVYRIIVREHAEALALLGVLLEYTPQPKKRSKQGGEETLEESTARHSSPRAWVIAVIPVPDAFAPLPTSGELGMNIDTKWGLPACMRRLSPQTTSLQILDHAEVGSTASADHLLQMAAMPLEHKTTALGIPYARPVAYHFDGAEALQQSLFSLFALLITGDAPRHCPSATVLSWKLCKAARTDSAHITSVAFSLAALQTGRSTLAVAGVFGAGKTRSLTFLLVWLALTTNLKIGVVHKENPAGRAITKLLGSLALDNEQAKLFVRAVSREEDMANAASTRYDIAMQYCSGAIPVIATTGLVWEQKAHMHSALRVHMEQVDILVGEEAQQDMDLKSAFVPAIPRQPFLRLLFGDPKQSPGGVADNLREHRALLLKAPIGLLAAHRWYMPHDLPVVLCNLLHSSTEVPLDMLSEAAEEASRGRLGGQWYTEQHCPSSSPVGAALQAAHKDLGKVDFSTPEGLLAGLGYAITRPGHCYQFQQANLASERSGVSGVHQWSVMLPTSARVAQEVYEPLIGIQYPMLCSCKNGRWQIGTGSIRLNEKTPTGLRFVQWIHQDPREATRADPPPESARAVYLQITRKDSATSLRSFCHQSRRNTNVETAVKVAGATAKHCIVLHGQSVLACPLNMHGLEGAAQVIAALLHGVCTVRTGQPPFASLNTMPGR